MIFWTLVKPIPKCWLFFQVHFSEQSHKMVARLASVLLLPSVFLLLGGMEMVTSVVLSQWRGLVSPAQTSAQKSVQLELDKTTLPFFLKNSLMLSKNLHWVCSISEMFFFRISHWPLWFLSWELGWDTRRMRKRSLILWLLWIWWLKPWEQIKLKLQFGKCNLIK